MWSLMDWHTSLNLAVCSYSTVRLVTSGRATAAGTPARSISRLPMTIHTRYCRGTETRCHNQLHQIHADSFGFTCRDLGISVSEISASTPTQRRWIKFRLWCQNNWCTVSKKTPKLFWLKSWCCVGVEAETKVNQSTEISKTSTNRTKTTVNSWMDLHEKIFWVNWTFKVSCIVLVSC